MSGPPSPPPLTSSSVPCLALPGWPCHCEGERRPPPGRGGGGGGDLRASPGTAPSVGEVAAGPPRGGEGVAALAGRWAAPARG